MKPSQRLGMCHCTLSLQAFHSGRLDAISGSWCETKALATEVGATTSATAARTCGKISKPPGSRIELWPLDSTIYTFESMTRRSSWSYNTHQRCFPASNTGAAFMQYLLQFGAISPDRIFNLGHRQTHLVRDAHQGRTALLRERRLDPAIGHDVFLLRDALLQPGHRFDQVAENRDSFGFFRFRVAPPVPFRLRKEGARTAVRAHQRRGATEHLRQAGMLQNVHLHPDQWRYRLL